jgi:hypothetical protein
MAKADSEKWFFVLHLGERERPSANLRYEIQLLNTNGQAIACGYVDDQADRLQLEELLIPLPVIQAARRQPSGNGDYVDESGRSISAF